MKEIKGARTIVPFFKRAIEEEGGKVVNVVNNGHPKFTVERPNGTRFTVAVATSPKNRTFSTRMAMAEIRRKLREDGNTVGWVTEVIWI